MSRRIGYPLYNNRYCGNKNKMEVHDLDNEDKNASGCQIDEMMVLWSSVQLYPLRNHKIFYSGLV